VGKLCKHLFEEKGAKYLALAADMENPVSNRVYEKLGFRFHCKIDRLLIVNNNI